MTVMPLRLGITFGVFGALVLAGAGSGCSKMTPSPGLVDTATFGTTRGLHIARVQTHFHSPFSFDACDSKGLVNGVPNSECLHHIKQAVCTNHVNLTFFTDHSEHMSEYDFSQLIQVESGDTAIYNGSSEPIGNQVGCDGGFAAILAPGLEGRLLALGMDHHTSTDLATRQATYGAEDNAAFTTLETSGNAVVGIPHSESRSLATIQTAVGAGQSFMEIYNVHANTDPKIRKSSLGLPPFEHIAKFINYLVDPYNSLNADFLFMEYFELPNLYLEKWNALLAGGYHIAGVGGLDSHENVFPQHASDGERLDGHRRMTRFMSNWVMTSAYDIASVKSAIKTGRIYFVLEGLGTPSGLDFYGTVAGSTVEMGLDAPPFVGAQSSSIVATVPTVLPSSMFMEHRHEPYVAGELHYIDGTGTETVVARALGGEQIVYNDPPTGYYRLHVYMVPLHTLTTIFNRKYAGHVYPWVISNPVRVVR